MFGSNGLLPMPPFLPEQLTLGRIPRKTSRRKAPETATEMRWPKAKRRSRVNNLGRGGGSVRQLVRAQAKKIIGFSTLSARPPHIQTNIQFPLPHR
jgi:hypothetical protein